MKPEDIVNSLGDISDSLLMQADIPAPRRSLYKTLSIAAAAVLLVCSFAIPLVLQRGDAPNPVSVPDKVLQQDILGGVSNNYVSDISDAQASKTPSENRSDALSDTPSDTSSDTFSNMGIISGDASDVQSEISSNTPSDTMSDNSYNGEDSSLDKNSTGATTRPEWSEGSGPDNEISSDCSSNETSDSVSSDQSQSGLKLTFTDNGAVGGSFLIKTLSTDNSKKAVIMIVDMLLYNNTFTGMSIYETEMTKLEIQNAYARAYGYYPVACSWFLSDDGSFEVYFYRSETDDSFLMAKDMRFYAVSSWEYQNLISLVYSNN